jgi:hypothetical protein
MSTTEQYKTVIRGFFEAWNNRRPEAFDEFIASDVVRHCQATPAVEVRSLDQLKEFLQQDGDLSRLQADGRAYGCRG